MNNGTMSGWVEAVLLSLAFLTIFTLIVVEMNDLYNQDNDIGLVDESTQQALKDYMDTTRTNVQEGTVDYDSQEGITLKESYGITIGAINIIWDFITGGWIRNVISKLNLGEAGDTIATTLQILYFLSLVFALLFALFKIRI